MSSVYERREFGWRDRLRRLVGHEDRTGSEIITKDGEPVLVVARGELVGYRCRDGSVLKFPAERPRRLEDPFDDEGDTEWVLVGGRWRQRWR